MCKIVSFQDNAKASTILKNMKSFQYDSPTPSRNVDYQPQLLQRWQPSNTKKKCTNETLCASNTQISNKQILNKKVNANFHYYI